MSAILAKSSIGDKAPKQEDDIYTLKQKVNQCINTLDKNMDAVFLKQEETYMTTALNFFKVKERELNEQLQLLKDKNNSLNEHDEEIV